MLKRTFEYSHIQGAVQAYAEGYFIWDLFMSAWHLEIFGLGFLAHAASAVMVFSLGFVRIRLLYFFSFYGDTRIFLANTISARV